MWDPNVGPRMSHQLTSGRSVVMRTASSATLLMTVEQGRTLAARLNTHDPQWIDGLGMPAGSFDATSCGLWIPGMYRSSRPIVVIAFTADEADRALTEAHRIMGVRLPELHRQDPMWVARVPVDHPDRPCPVNHCPLVVATSRDRDAPRGERPDV